MSNPEVTGSDDNKKGPQTLDQQLDQMLASIDKDLTKVKLDKAKNKLKEWALELDKHQIAMAQITTERDAFITNLRKGVFPV